MSGSPVFRIVDLAEALNGPLSLPHLRAEHLDAWAASVLPRLQRRMLDAAYGLTPGPARAKQAGYNALITVAELAPVVCDLADVFALLVASVKAEWERLPSVDEDAEYAATMQMVSGVFLHLIHDLERRYGERGQGHHDALH